VWAWESASLWELAWAFALESGSVRELALEWAWESGSLWELAWPWESGLVLHFAHSQSPRHTQPHELHHWRSIQRCTSLAA
jgi:hypothetical protein